MVNCLFSKPARNSGPTEQVAGTSLSSTPQIRVQPRSHPAVPAVRMSSKESDSRMSVEQQIAQLIATEIAAKATQVVAAIGLLDEGATVPFIARYRKEVTGGLDDPQLRTLEDRKSVVEGKSVSVRVELGGGRRIK